MKRRIIRADSMNWAIQEWQSGGDTIDRGRYAGQTRQAKWKQPEIFYAHLSDAAKRLFEEEIADGWTGKDLAAKFQEAETRICTYLQELCEAQKTDTMIGVLQERGYTVTDGKKGRTNYVEES